MPWTWGLLPLLLFSGCVVPPFAADGADTLVAAGDTVLCRWEHDLVARHGFDWPLARVKPILDQADAALCNLECCVSRRGEPVDKGERCSFYYRARPEMLACLTRAGIDVVCAANNHVGDYGPEGVAETCRWTREAGLVAPGCGLDPAGAERPRLVQVGATLVAFAAMHTSPAGFAAAPGRPGTCWVDEKEEDLAGFTARIDRLAAWARNRCHLLVLTIHWGRNWVRRTQPVHRRMARIAFARGVDLILGHSAHRLQGIEVIGGKVVIYDMGNLFFDCKLKEEGRRSVLFRLRLSPRGVHRVEILPILALTGRALPASPAEGESILAEMEKLSRRMGTVLWRKKDEKGRPMGVVEVAAPSATRRPGPRGEKPPLRPTAKKSIQAPRPDWFVATAPPAAVAGGLPARALAPGIELVGKRLPPRVRAGRILPITTWLRVTEKIDRHLLLAYRLTVGGRTARRGTSWYTRHDPADWALPFARIRPGEVVRDTYPARLSGLPAGTCHLFVQVIDPALPPARRTLGELPLGRVVLE